MKLSNENVIDLLGQSCIHLNDELRVDLQDWFSAQTSNEFNKIWLSLDRNQKDKLYFVSASVLSFDSWNHLVRRVILSDILETAIEEETKACRDDANRYFRDANDQASMRLDTMKELVAVKKEREELFDQCRLLEGKCDRLNQTIGHMQMELNGLREELEDYRRFKTLLRNIVE